MNILNNGYNIINTRKTLLFPILVLIFALANCAYQYPTTIPTGSWKYKLLVNGAKVGHAVLSNTKKDNHYVSTSQLIMVTGRIENRSSQITTETLDFKAVRLESNNTIIDGDKKQQINTLSDFLGKKVKLTIDNKTTTVVIPDDFRLEGNYLLHRLIKEKFKPGVVIEYNIYDPTIELESVIRVKAKVAGLKNVELHSGTKKLIHISQAIEGIKSVDFFLDEQGIMQQTIIQMLNMSIVLIRE